LRTCAVLAVPLEYAWGKPTARRPNAPGARAAEAQWFGLAEMKKASQLRETAALIRPVRMARLFSQFGGGVEDDVQRSDLRGFGVSVHQESLAILAYVIRELIC
jgi:hypothetical protein